MPPVGQASFEGGQKAIVAFQIEVNLRNQDKVYILSGQGGGSRDKAGMAAHQLDQADAVGVGLRLVVSPLDGLGGYPDRGVKTKGSGNQMNIVVNGFGNADDTDVEPAVGNFLGNTGGRHQGAVAAHHKQHADIGALQGID